jgi:hypothetical protein
MERDIRTLSIFREKCYPRESNLDYPDDDVMINTFRGTGLDDDKWNPAAARETVTERDAQVVRHRTRPWPLTSL